RDQVVDQRCSTWDALVVKHDFLEHCLPDALCDAAMHLPFGEQRVDDAAAIVDSEEPDQTRIAGLHVDFDHCAMGSEWVASVAGEVGIRSQAGLHSVRKALTVARGRGQCGPREGALRNAGHAYRPADKDDVLGARLEQMRSQVTSLVTHLP